MMPATLEEALRIVSKEKYEKSLHEMIQHAHHHHKNNDKMDTSNLHAGATGDEVGRLLASQHGNKGRDSTELKEKWVVSENFVPMEVPVDAVHPVRIPSGRSKSHTVGPIVIEDNFRGVEQKEGETNEGNGLIPPVVIIDGQHRWADAKGGGQETLQAIVGERAVPKLNQVLLRHHFHRHSEKHKRRNEVERYSKILHQKLNGPMLFMGEWF